MDEILLRDRPDTIPQEGIDVVWRLLDQFNHLQYKHLALFLLVTRVAVILGKPLKLLICTDDALQVERIASSMEINLLSFSESWFPETKTCSSKFVQGRKYSVTSMGSIDQPECHLISNLEILKPSELERVLELDIGLIACVPKCKISKTSMASQFDLVLEFDPEFPEYADLNIGHLIYKPVYTEYERQSKEILKDYFMECRGLIGQRNENAKIPVYDPARMLTIGLALAEVFRHIRYGDNISRSDTLLAIMVQDMSLEARLGEGLFGKHEAPIVPSAMPSPCPSNSSKLEAYEDVIRSIKAQIFY